MVTEMNQKVDFVIKAFITNWDILAVLKREIIK